MLSLNRNMNVIDRSARVIIGISLLLAGPMTNIVETDTLSDIILGILGMTAVLSGTFAYCFLYEVTGFNTLSEQTENNQDS